MSKRFLSLLAVGLILGCLPACGGGSDKIKVAFVTNNTAEFWLHAQKGAEKAAAEENVELIFQRPSDGSAREQQRIIDTMAPRGVKALSVSVISPENQTKKLNEIADKMPLIAVDNDASESNRLLYIGTNNVAAGRQVGELVKEVMPQGGVVSLYVGQLEPINARERAQGVREALGFEKGSLKSKDGKYTLEQWDPHTDNISSRVAQSNAEAVLAKNKDEKNLCMVGLWAYNAPAILKAVKNAGRLGEVKIVGFDEDLNTLQGIEDGRIYATVVQNPFQFGYQAVKHMAKLARGEKVDIPKDKLKYIAERVVTKEGENGRLKAAKFREDMRKQLGK